MKNRYIDAFSRLKEGLSKVSRLYDINIISLYWDAAKCFIRYGVTPNEYLGWRFYQLSHLERSRFYTARDSRRWEQRFNDPNYADYFNQKQLTNKKFREFIKRDWLYTKDCHENDIKKFLVTHPKVIVKPIGLSSGRGIHVANNENVQELMKGDYLLEEFIVQHSRMSILNESSVNSIRIYTLKTLDGNIKICSAPHVYIENDVIFLSASIRVGGVGSEVDNYHAGGIGYPIEIQTGVVSGAGTTISGEKVLYHPGSGAKVIGSEIPNWKQLVQFVIQLCHVVPKARLIAWDIAVLENGFELIEANYDGDPGFMQAPTQTGKKKIIIHNYR